MSPGMHPRTRLAAERRTNSRPEYLPPPARSRGLHRSPAHGAAYATHGRTEPPYTAGSRGRASRPPLRAQFSHKSLGLGNTLRLGQRQGLLDDGAEVLAAASQGSAESGFCVDSSARDAHVDSPRTGRIAVGIGHHAGHPSPNAAAMSSPRSRTAASRAGKEGSRRTVARLKTVFVDDRCTREYGMAKSPLVR